MTNFSRSTPSWMNPAARATPRGGVVCSMPEFKPVEASTGQSPVRHGCGSSPRPATASHLGMSPVPEPAVAIPGINSQPHHAEQRFPRQGEDPMHSGGIDQPADVALGLTQVADVPLPHHLRISRKGVQNTGGIADHQWSQFKMLHVTLPVSRGSPGRRHQARPAPRRAVPCAWQRPSSTHRPAARQQDGPSPRA